MSDTYDDAPIMTYTGVLFQEEVVFKSVLQTLNIHIDIMYMQTFFLGNI